MKKILIALTALAVFTACHKDENKDEVVKADRTVLVYWSGENNLTTDADSDLKELIQGSATIGNNNLLIFMDRADSNELPWFARIKDKRIVDSVSISDMKIEADYAKDPYASDANIMEKVIRYAFEKYPSAKNDYALVFGGHGSGWQMEDSLNNYNAMARKKAYGVDNGRNDRNSATGKWMNIATMAKVLSHFPQLSYIFFDCCHMQCLEVAYELRNVTKYTIGSPAEIPAVGAPYETLTPALFETTTFYTSLVDKYFAQRAGTLDVPLSVIKTSEMENLANATKNILKTFAGSWDGNYPDMSGLIHYYYNYGAGRNEFYDANDFMLKYATIANYQTWKQALEKAVVYKKMAKEWMTWIVPFYGSWGRFYGDFEMTEEKFSGVSMFVPQYKEQSDNNKDIKNTSWYYAAGYQDIGW